MQSSGEMTARTWLRIKVQLGGGRVWRTYLLLMVAALGVFLLVYWYLRPHPVIKMRYIHEPPPDRMSDDEIAAYIGAMTDPRQEHCYAQHFDVNPRQTVSIVVDYREEQFYLLKLALRALLKRTQPNLYTELIVIDDGTKDKVIQQRAAAFFRQLLLDHPGRLKTFRLEKTQGVAAARHLASNEATGSVLVFLGVETVVNARWLEPLLTALRKDPYLIAVPHFDILMPPANFYTRNESLVNVFGWPLNTVYYDGVKTAQHSDDLLPTMVMRGDVFAVNKDWFKKIGGYDEVLEDGGGQDVELSLRAWLCGGSLAKVGCSRVALFEGLRQKRVTSALNARRIVELWFDDNYKQHVYRQTEFSSAESAEEQRALAKRRDFLHDLQCKTLQWLLDRFPGYVTIPSAAAVNFGRLRDGILYCLRGIGRHAVEAVACQPFMYRADEMFEMDSEGHIVYQTLTLPTQRRCLQAISDTVSLTECRHSISNQIWHHTADEHLTTDSDPEQCLEHVTTYSSVGAKHQLKVSPCNKDESQRWHFVSY